MLVIFRPTYTQLSTLYYHIEIYFDQVTCTTPYNGKCQAYGSYIFINSLSNVFTVDTIVVSILKWNPYHFSSSSHPPSIFTISFIRFIPCWPSITPVMGLHGQWMGKTTWNTDIAISDKTMIIIDDVCMQPCGRFTYWLHILHTTYTIVISAFGYKITYLQ